MAIRVSWGIWNPHFGERGCHRGSAMAAFERAMAVSYRLCIVTVALSVTIRPQFVIECLHRSYQQGGGSLWAKISGCSPWSRPLMLGSAESECPTLTNREIIFEEFQPMLSQSTNVRGRRRDRRSALHGKNCVAVIIILVGYSKTVVS